MRPPMLALAALVALAGCVGAPAESASQEPLADLPADLEGGTLEGTHWLAPSSGNAREEALLEIPANHSWMPITARLALGTMYGPLELPETTADVLVELRGPDGTVLAEGALGTGSRELTLEAMTEQEGPHVLALLSYGGSGGEGRGDHVHYHVEVGAASPPGA